MSEIRQAAIDARDVEAKIGTSYPKPFRSEVATRSKRILGDLFGLKNFGVNLVDLEPGSWSSQRHWHTHEDEFVYVVAGEVTLITDKGDQVLTPGMVAGFPAGSANGHHLVNKSDSVATYLEVGGLLFGFRPRCFRRARSPVFGSPPPPVSLPPESPPCSGALPPLGRPASPLPFGSFFRSVSLSRRLEANDVSGAAVELGRALVGEPIESALLLQKDEDPRVGERATRNTRRSTLRAETTT